MTTPDIVERLRRTATALGIASHPEPVLLHEAADEIERLCAAKRRALRITDEFARRTIEFKARLAAKTHE